MLSQFKQIKLVETGERYVSDLVDLDAAVGSYLLDSIDNLRNFSTAKKHDAFNLFTKRDKKRKLYLSSEVDPKRFITHIRQTYFNKNEENNRENTNPLPLIYFHRAPDFTPDSEGKEIVIKDIGQICNEQGEIIAKIDAIPLVLTYYVYVLAWEQVSLTKLTAGIFSAMATKPRLSNYKTMIFNDVFESEAIISPMQSQAWSDMSAENTEDRLLVLQSSFEVQANIYQARVVTNQEITITVSEPTPFFTFDEVRS